MSKKETLTILEKIDVRFIYGTLLLTLAFVTLVPIGLPFTIGEQSKKAYNLIEALPAGTVVGFVPDLDAMGWLQGGPPAIAYARHLFRRPLKIVIFVMLSTDAVGLTFSILDQVKPETLGKKYGEDWIFLGYAAGGEAAYAASADDLWRTFGGRDYYGKSLEDLPLAKSAKSAKDIPLLVVPESGGAAILFVRHWNARYQTQIICNEPPMIVPQYTAYERAGQISVVNSGLRDGAEYEKLIGQPGLSLAAMDGLSAATFLLLGYIVIGNIGFLKRKLSKEA
ncbi:MAG: hypothetical protein V1857_04865 [archaeon]